MISMTLLCFLWLFAVTTALPLRADGWHQGRDKSPPSLKVERAGALPPSSIRKRFDRQKNITYVDIDVPLPQREQSAPVTTAGQPVSTGEISLSFRLEYKGASASELSAAHLTISFTGGEKLAEGQTSGREVEVRADAYQYTYQSAGSLTEPTPESAARSAMPGGESITVELPLEDLQQVAYANRVDIKVGKKELRVRSIQLGDLRKTLIAQNAN